MDVTCTMKTTSGRPARRLLPLLGLSALLALCLLLCSCGSNEQVSLPILMYHHLLELPEDTNISTPVTCFEEQMRALSEAGYHTVSLEDLLAWVEDGVALPDKPILITFDDGYESCYRLAYPILQRYGFQATFFVIGVSVGKTTYKDTDIPISPHFSLEQAAEMEASGLICIQSHGYDIHEVENVDPAPIRKGIRRREGESEEAYRAFLHEDCAKMRALLGRTPYALSYPGGYCDDLADEVLREEGVRITMTTKKTVNQLVVGDMQCLWRMGRINCNGSRTGQQLLDLLAGLQ